MTVGTSLALVLPQRFLGFFPLFIGVEIVLGIAILNKAGGVYGVLSIFTGHPINFWQWLYNVLAISTLPFYVQAVIHLNNKPKNVRKVSLATVVYTWDTLIGLLYTLYFVYFWFSREDAGLEVDARDVASPKAVSATADPVVDLSSQSASQTRELFLTFSGTLIVTVARIYFNLVMLSFSKALLKQYTSEHRYNDNLSRDDEEVDLARSTGFVANIKKLLFKWETSAKIRLNELLNE